MHKPLQKANMIKITNEPPSDAEKYGSHSAEKQRMLEQNKGEAAWRLWGPYLSERQWGTVREDYSEYGNAWDYFSHDQARSRAYRWGEDGIAGFCDEKQRLCMGLGLWNEQDPILKERLFGLTNGEGNHGEDVKELYFYLDATERMLSNLVKENYHEKENHHHASPRCRPARR